MTVCFSSYIFSKVYYRVDENEESGNNSNTNEILSSVASELKDSVYAEETLSAVASKLDDSEEPVDLEDSEAPSLVNDGSIGQKKKGEPEAQERKEDSTDDNDPPMLVEGI